MRKVQMNRFVKSLLPVLALTFATASCKYAEQRQTEKEQLTQDLISLSTRTFEMPADTVSYKQGLHDALGHLRNDELETLKRHHVAVTLTHAFDKQKYIHGYYQKIATDSAVVMLPIACDNSNTAIHNHDMMKSLAHDIRVKHNHLPAGKLYGIRIYSDGITEDEYRWKEKSWGHIDRSQNAAMSLLPPRRR